MCACVCVCHCAVPAQDGSNAYALFNLLDADGDGSLNNMELIDFSSSHNINVSTLTTALGLTGKQKEISKADFFTKYQNGELDFLKDIKTDLSRAKRNSVKRKKKEVNVRTGQHPLSLTPPPPPPPPPPQTPSIYG